MTNACEKIEFDCTFASVEELYYCLENNTILNVQKIISFENDDGMGEYKFFDGITNKDIHLFICPVIYDIETSIKAAFMFSKSCQPEYLIFFAPFFSLKILSLINKYKAKYSVNCPIIHGNIDF